MPEGVTLLETIGTLLAVGGTIISIIGVYQNNIHKNHLLAMQWWMYSNVMLCLWAIGNLLGCWNGGLSIGAIAVLYGVFTVTNAYGLMK